MRLFKKKGFTLVEMLVASLLLCILMLILSGVTSVLTTVVNDVDTLSNFSPSLYLMDTLQTDMINATSIRISDNSNILIISPIEEISYTIDKGTIYRKNKPVVDVVTGNFLYENNFLTFEGLLIDHTPIHITFYTGGCYAT